MSLASLSRLFDWRDALVVARPETLIRWHRAGWRLFWRIKSRPGRPPIPLELRRLIRRMATENPIWGEERIANELLLKLGLRVSPKTVRKYMPKRPPDLHLILLRAFHSNAVDRARAEGHSDIFSQPCEHEPAFAEDFLPLDEEGMQYAFEDFEHHLDED